MTEALKIAKSLVKTFSADITIVALLVQGFLYRTHIKCPTFATSPLVFALSAELYPENHCTTHINCGHFYFLCRTFQIQKRPHQWYNDQRVRLEYGSSQVHDRIKPKTYKIGICCFSAKPATLRSKSKDQLLGIRIICQSRVICLPEDCCFSNLAL